MLLIEEYGTFKIALPLDFKDTAIAATLPCLDLWPKARRIRVFNTKQHSLASAINFLKEKVLKQSLFLCSHYCNYR
jgi:hypothetical protein